MVDTFQAVNYNERGQQTVHIHIVVVFTLVNMYFGWFNAENIKFFEVSSRDFKL